MSVSNQNSSRGYIALISVLILGFVFLMIVISAAELGLTGRALLGMLEDKAQSEEAAEACVQLARIQVVNDPNVTLTNFVVSETDFTCTIASLTHGGGQSTIKAHAAVRGSVTNFVVTVSSSNASVNSWREYSVLP